MMRALITLTLLILSFSGFADGNAGDVASNTNTILDNVIGIITVILYIAALGVFVSATMKYRIHRQNPQQIPLSTPLTELVLAIVLAALPTVSKMSNQHLTQMQSPPPPPAPALYRGGIVTPPAYQP
jgi:heme/copper-type cytochrome/quinol oxidase subunit 2